MTPSEHAIDAIAYTLIAAYALYVLNLWLGLRRRLGRPAPRVLTPILLTSGALFMAAVGIDAIALLRLTAPLDTAAQWGPVVRRVVGAAIFVALVGTNLWYVRREDSDGV